jgi:DNA-binding response OmpR family regulator
VGIRDCDPEAIGFPDGSTSLTAPIFGLGSSADDDPMLPSEAPTFPEVDASPHVSAHGNLELRPAEYQALVEDKRVNLTIREFQVLYALAEREDRVVRREDIYRRVWGREMKYRERAVDVFVRKVRNKLAATSPGWVYIHTHFGVGYRFTPERLEPGVTLP